ncbi:hypothetical protein ACFSKI_10830 [Pseudogracilibacillus auburnensis]|uniref:hypothetical protein n=1 Tax=Pseudogracilibacillus auburnensis TaxID=1494959 RepID=UPI000D75B753|nr:hypothetical protein [Pseudogracilibacillus auburnensis]
MVSGRERCGKKKYTPVTCNSIDQKRLKPYYPIVKKINESLSIIDYKVIDTKTHGVFKVENQHFLRKA